MEQTESEIEELRQEVEELKEITVETNRQVHKMRRGARFALVLQLVWWLSILGITGAAYYYYVQPYIERIGDFYQSAQHGASQAGDWGAQIRDFFDKYFSQPGSNETTQ